MLRSIMKMIDEGKSISIGILTNMPTPYRKPMWEAYAKIPDTELHIYYCVDSESDRKWKVAKAKNVHEHFLRGVSFGITNHVNREILGICRRHDLWLVGGYSTISSQLLILACKFFRKPYVILFDGISPKKLKIKESYLKFKWKKFLAKSCSAWLGNGIVGRLYAKKLGIENEKVFNQYLTVDTVRFKSLLSRKAEFREAKRSTLGIPSDAFVILYVGRIIKEKGLHDLIAAFIQAKEANKKVHLLIVGHGEYETQLKSETRGIEDLIFTGHVEYDNIHEFYFASDLFVLPTYDDVWGLAVAEALACGIPAVTTTAAGIGMDMENLDYLIEPGDVNACADKILKISRNELPGNSEISLSRWSFDDAAKSLETIIEIVEKRNEES